MAVLAFNGDANIRSTLTAALILGCYAVCLFLSFLIGQPSVQAATLQGTWQFAVAANANTMTIQPTGDISIQWIGDRFDVTTKTVFKADGLDSQEFTGKLSLGAIQASSTLLFDASLASFSKFETTLNFQALDISWSAKAHVAPTASNNSLEITGNTDLSWARWSADVVMKSCPSMFSSAKIKLQDISFCASSVDIGLSFSGQGFESFELSTSGLTIPGIQILTTSLRLKLKPSQQELLASFALVPAQSGQCLKLGWKLVSAGGTNTSITGIELAFIDMSFTLEDITTHFLHTAIWDLMELSGYFPVFSDMTSDWRIQIYLENQTSALFGFDKLVFDSHLPLGANLKLETQVTLSSTVQFKWILQGGFSL